MSKVKNREVRAMFRTLERLPYTACQEGLVVAKTKAPVASGKLRDSIKVSSSVSNPDDIQATVYTNIPYAQVIEFGTAHAPAQPFMAPAFTRVSYYVTRTLNRL
jgi:HK97 gp10 family phage protein